MSAALRKSGLRPFDYSVMNALVGSGLAPADIDGDPTRRWVPIGRTSLREDLLKRSPIAILARRGVQAPGLIVRAAKVTRESPDIACVAGVIDGSTGIGNDPDAEDGVDPTRQFHERSRALGSPRNCINCSRAPWVGSPQHLTTPLNGRPVHEVRPWATLPNLPSRLYSTTMVADCFVAVDGLSSFRRRGSGS